MKNDQEKTAKLDRRIGWITGKMPKQDSKLVGLFKAKMKKIDDHQTELNSHGQATSRQDNNDYIEQQFEGMDSLQYQQSVNLLGPINEIDPRGVTGFNSQCTSGHTSKRGQRTPMISKMHENRQEMM